MDRQSALKRVFIREKVAKLTVSAWIGMGVGGFIGFTCAFTVVYTIYNAQPVIVSDVREDQLPVISGDHMDIMAKRSGKLDCMTRVARWLYRPDPLHPGYMEWQALRTAPFSPPTMANLTPYRLYLPIPASIEPGVWTYTAQAIDECNTPFNTKVRTSPSFQVTINPGKPIAVPPDDKKE